MQRVVLFASVAVLAGCGVTLDFDPPDPRDAGGGGNDLGGERDLGHADLGTDDLGLVDAGLIDLGLADVGPPFDGGVRDAIVLDGMVGDAITVDGPVRDFGMDLTVRDLGAGDLGMVTICSSPTSCGLGQYCMLPFGVCTFSGGFGGMCALMPGGCGPSIAAVCGCDGVTYANACLAAAAGVNVLTDGPCPSTCVPTTGCCCSALDCTAAESCLGDLTAGGTCHAPPPTGRCWTDADCIATGGTCHSAVICPSCLALCLMPDMPGNCG